jgi:hypothetical protein
MIISFFGLKRHKIISYKYSDGKLSMYCTQCTVYCRCNERFILWSIRVQKYLAVHC